MGIFDRVTNLGKGVGKVWAKSAKDALDNMMDGTDAPAAASNPVGEFDRKLLLLKRLRQEGMLTEDEFQAKRAALAVSVTADEPPEVVTAPAATREAPRPKRRSLDPIDDDEQPSAQDAPQNRKPRKRNL